MGQSNSGVSSRALDNCSTRTEKSLFLRILDDVERGSVLDTSTGVLEFSLAQDIAAGLLREALQADQWGISNGCIESNC